MELELDCRVESRVGRGPPGRDPHRSHQLRPRGPAMGTAGQYNADRIPPARRPAAGGHPLTQPPPAPNRTASPSSATPNPCPRCNEKIMSGHRPAHEDPVNVETAVSTSDGAAEPAPHPLTAGLTSSGSAPQHSAATPRSRAKRECQVLYLRSRPTQVREPFQLR